MLNKDDFETFVRTPFVVRATKITEENIDEIAKMIGEVRVKDGEKYLALDRQVVRTVGFAYIGWYMTVLNGSIRCYAPKVFKAQFEKVGEDNTYTFQIPDGDFELPFVGDKE